MSILTFQVVGTPAPQGSKKFVGKTKTGRPLMVDDSKKTRPWRTDVREAARVAMEGLREDDRKAFWLGPVAIDVVFGFSRPKGHYGTGRNSELLKEWAPSHVIGVPDIDKLLRSTLDAMTGVVFADDKSVADLRGTKIYILKHAMPGAVIRVRRAAIEEVSRDTVMRLGVVK